MPSVAAPTLRLFGIFAVLSGLIGFGIAVLHGSRNRHPLPVNLEELKSGAYLGRHILVTNCQLDLLNAVGTPALSNSRPYELLVPLRSVDNSRGEVHSVLLTRHPIYIATYLQLQRFKAPEGTSWVSQNRDMVFPKRSIDGVGRLEKISNWPSLRSHSVEISSEFSLVTDSAIAQRKWPRALSGASVCLLFLGLFAFTKR